MDIDNKELLEKRWRDCLDRAIEKHCYSLATKLSEDGPLEGIDYKSLVVVPTKVV